MEGAAYVNGGDGAGVSSSWCVIMGKRWEKRRYVCVDLAWGEHDLRNGE
jgi:hypothetical protein